MLSACNAREAGFNTQTGCVAEGHALAVDIVRPAPEHDRHRAVMLVHGGGWSAGSRGDYAPLARALAAKGYTAVSIDYRLSPAVRHPQHLADVVCQFRWLRAQAAALQVDPERIGVIGGSAGAHLSALLGYASGERPAALVVHGGPHDLPLAMGQLPPPSRGALQALFGSANPSEAQLREASPVVHVRRGAPPTLILHGEHDPLVPVTQAEALAAALTAAQVPHQLRIIPGAGHGDFGPAPAVSDATGRLLLDFLAASLR